jgi:hypothetical protein
MSAVRPNGIEVPVSVALDVSYRHAEATVWREEFGARLERRVARLAAEIGLPARMRAQLALAEQLEQRTGRQLEILIGGKACRTDWTQAIAPGAEAVEVAERVFETLYWNRHLVLTPTVMELLQQECQALSGRELAVLLGDALRHGISIPAALEAISQCSSAREVALQPDYALEWLLAHRFPRVLTVEFGRRQFDSLKRFDEMAAMMRDGLFYEMGVKFPRLRRVFSEDLDDDQFRVCVGAIAGPVRRGLGVGENFVNDSVARLTLLNIKSEERINPTNGVKHAVVSDQDADLCESTGLTTWDSSGFVVLAISFDLRRHAASFLTMRHVEHILKRLSEAFPMPIFNALERYGMADLHATFRLLLEEGVSIRNLRDVLEAVLEFEGVVAADAVDAVLVYPAEGYVLEGRNVGERHHLAAQLAAHVRVALQWQLGEKHTDPSMLVEIGPVTEARLHDSALPLSTDERVRLHSALAGELANADSIQRSTTLLASGPVRRRLYELVSLEFPRLPVLSRDEMPTTGQGRIKIALDPLAPAA